MFYDASSIIGAGFCPFGAAPFLSYVAVNNYHILHEITDRSISST